MFYDPDLTLTSKHLAWILNITREWHRDFLSASEVQQRMDAKFPAIEHRAIWSRLIDAQVLIHRMPKTYRTI